MNNESLCEVLQIENIIDKNKLKAQIEEGWEKLTEAYKDEHVIVHKNDHGGDFITKFKHMNTIDEELVLGILGVIRQHVVKKMFKCISQNYNEKHTYNAAGSTNITSDYDLAISGPFSNEIMWKMFQLFLKSWGKSIPHSFDTNIYTGATSYYTNDIINDERIQKFENHDKEQLFLMVPKSDKDKENLFTWACVKLIEAGINPTNENSNLNNLLQKAQSLKNALNTKYCNVNIDIKDENSTIIDISKYDDKTKKIIKNYYLQYIFGKPVEDYLHKRVIALINPMPMNDIVNLKWLDENNLFYLRGLNNFFSSEAYYTDATVYAIVLEEQLHYNNLNLNAETYLASAIENLGDFIHHISGGMKENNDENKNKKLLIKFSKYLYRFNLMLGHYYEKIGQADNQFIKTAHDINKHVIPLRATYVINGRKAERAFKKLDYSSDQSLKKYVENIKEHYLSHISEIMSKDNQHDKKEEDDNITNVISSDLPDHSNIQEKSEELLTGGVKKFKKKFKKQVNKQLRKKRKKKTMKKKKKRKNRTFKKLK
tara:strand:+ start:30801 stop:32423 length:1623 start_codon:yes stop_codon:yes gene_type:complete